VEGYSYEEVSKILGVGLGTVKSRIARGTQHPAEPIAGFFEL
jgi:DNA-directed RNA polymerase specialized sigma24 family protein